jgi:hypothetical protein
MCLVEANGERMTESHMDLPQGTLGDVRKQPPREILRPHAQRAETAGSRKKRMGQVDGSSGPGVEDGLGARHAQ